MVGNRADASTALDKLSRMDASIERLSGRMDRFVRSYEDRADASDWTVRLMKRNGDWTTHSFNAEAEARAFLAKRKQDKEIKEWSMEDPKGRAVYK